MRASTRSSSQSTTREKCTCSRERTGTLDPPVGYQLHQDYATGSSPGAVTGDSRTDVVVSTHYGFVCVLAKRAGHARSVSSQQTKLTGIALADVGGDGRPTS
jgi:hypothetical protein